MRGAAHQLVLTRLGPPVPDAEGRGKAQVVGQPLRVAGRLETAATATSRQTQGEEARQLVDNPEAVARVDVSVQVGGKPVDTNCQVERLDAPAPLAGRWDVAAVRHSPAHLRLLLRRPEGLRGR